MSGAAIREKHDGALGDRGSVRLWLRLLSCTMVMEKRVRRRLAAQFETTLPRFDVLAALERHPEGMTMGALSRSLLVSNGNVTALVRTLAAEGLVRMTTDPGDRRSSILRLTAEGRTAFAAMASAHHGWIDAMLRGMSLADRNQLFALLGELKGSLAKDQPEESAGEP